MTIEEAKEQLEDLILDRNSFDYAIFRRDAEALNMAIAALEKQIPKTPNRRVCSSCGSRHIYAATLMKAECFKYCGDCGQALDWSDNDD